ncbi:MAG TPA: hypothetical protein VIU16_03915 [Gaiellaceae bacterium]
MNLAAFATTRNLTILGVLYIVQALAGAALVFLDGNPSTNVDLNALKADIMLGVTMIMAKGAQSTGGTVPVTDEARARVGGFVRLRFVLGLAFAAALLFGAVLARADVDPTAGTVDGATVADATAQAAPDLRWSIKIGKVTLAPSASFTPAVLSLRDFKVSVGPNVGAGVDATRSDGYGLATHLAMRETTDGLKPLASLYAIVPALQRYGLRPGVSYQFGGGAAPWKDCLLFGLAGASNFGFVGR